MKRKIAAIAIVLVAVSTVLAASAYTTGSLDRKANVNVVTDDAGLIGLEDGTSGTLVYQNSTGALAIDFANESATGVNTAATFELGNNSDPTNQSAFNITNNDGTSHDMTVSYDGSDTQDADSNIKFEVYDSTGTLVGTADEEGSDATFTATSGETFYVVIIVDTHGLDSTADLSGTLTVSA